MADFDSSYPSTVDSKGRFLLPAGIKKQLQDGENTFMIRRGFEQYLDLFTIEKWEKEKAKFSDLNEYSKKVQKLKRRFIGTATEVSLDAAGRLLIQKDFLSHAEIVKDIMIVGQISHFEIWDKEKYEKLFEDDSSDYLSDLADEVFGKKYV